MTELEFDDLLRRALEEALLADYRAAVQDAATLDISFSDAYLRRREKLLLDPFGYAKRASRSVWRRVAHGVAILLLTGAVLFATLLTVPQTRAALKSFYLDWKSDHAEFHFQWLPESEAERVFVETDTLMRDYAMTLLRPELLPEGFTDISEQYTSEVLLMNDDGKKELVPFRDIVVYENAEGEQIAAHYGSIGNIDTQLGVNTENVDIYDRTVEDVVYHVFEYRSRDDLHVLVWEDETLPVFYVMTIASRFDIDTALTLAQQFRLIRDD